MCKFFILLMSLTLLFSSCAVKKALWEQLEVESAVPGKAYPSKALSFLCSESDGSLLDQSEVISSVSAKSPLLALSAFVVVSLTIPAALQPEGSAYPRFSYFNTARAPIYLRLGQLIYYS